MKKTFFTAAFAALSLCVQAQTDVMYVQDITCIPKEYKVSDVLEFSAEDPVVVTMADGTTHSYNYPLTISFGVLAALNNQYELTYGVNAAYDGMHDVKNFRAVQHYNVLTQEVESTDYHLDDIVVLHVSNNTLPYVTVADEPYKVVVPEDFRLTKNRLNDNISISGDVRMWTVDPIKNYDGGLATRLRIGLTMDPVTTYAAEQKMYIERFQTEPFSASVGSVLYKPVVGIGGGSPTLVIGDAVATDAAGMRQGHYALEVSVAGNLFKNGMVDLSDANAYTMHLYDYESGKSYDITSHYKGTITTLADPEKNGENIYIDIAFTDANTSCNISYFGPLTTVDDLEGLAPEVTETNNVILTNQSGVQTVNQEIKSMQVRESNDGTIYLYMMTDGTKPDDSMQTPLVQISPAHVNAGELSLPDLKEQWSVSYKQINVAYAKTEWHPAITNGTMKVEKNADGVWDVTVSLKNEYNNMGSVSGTGETLSIHYHGAASTYTGSKK